MRLPFSASYTCMTLLSVFVTLPVGSDSRAQDASPKNQVVELRTYTLANEQAEEALDMYLSQALLPALVRQGLGPIGVLDQVDGGESDQTQVLLIIPGPDVESVTRATARLADDDEYQQAAKSYQQTPAKSPLIKRIRSELLSSFDCWPQVTVPQQTKEGHARLFEMRVYESPTEHLGELKVEMFNSGEVPIFLDCQISPVFMGQALIGDLMPNLTYMTVYDDDAARQEAWKKFRVHPDWQILKEVKKYAGTVSKIHKSDWVSKPYSQL